MTKTANAPAGDSPQVYYLPIFLPDAGGPYLAHHKANGKLAILIRFLTAMLEPLPTGEWWDLAHGNELWARTHAVEPVSEKVITLSTAGEPATGGSLIILEEIVAWAIDH